MATINEYLRGIPERDPVRGKELDNLFRAISQFDSNRQTARTVGLDVPTGTNEGLLSKFMSGATAPGRAIRAGFLDAIGADIPELRNRSPFESAAAAFSGKIDVGFGDVPALKTRDNEGFLSRVGKLGVALAGDVFTDPISYVGAPSALGRGVAARVMFSSADDMLKKGQAALTARGQKEAADSLVPKLREQDRLVQAAREQSGTAATTGGRSPVDILGRKGGLTDEQRAANVFGSRVSEALLTRGRKGVVDEMTDIFGSQDVALEVLRSMPDEFLGGLRFVNPVTGRSIARLTPGTGTSLGPVGEAVNRARFAASATSVGNFPTRMMSGRSGATLADVKTGLRQKSKGLIDDVNRTRFSDYMATRQAATSMRVDKLRLNTRVQGVITGALARQNRFAGEEATQFERGLRDVLTGTTSEPVSSGARAEGRAEGARVWDELSNLYQEAKATGVDIGDLGPDYRPLILKEEEYARRQKLGITGNQGTAAYSPEGSRQMWFVYEPDVEVAAQLGWSVGDPRIRALTAREINERLVAAGKEAIYEENPYKVATRYSQSLIDRISMKRFTNSLQDAGVLLGDVELTRKVLRSQRVAELQSAVGKVATRLGRNIADDIKQTEKELAEQISGGATRDVSSRLTQLRKDATVAYVEADDAVVSLQARLTELSKEARELRPTVNQYVRTLKEYADLDVSASTVSAAGRQARTSEARAARAEARMDAASERLDEALVIDEALATSTDPRVAGAGLSARRQAEAGSALDEAAAAEEAARIARADVENLRGARNEAAGRLGVEQTAQVDKLIRTLEARARTADELVAARRVRAEAKKTRDRVYRQTEAGAYDGLQTAVNRFSARVQQSRNITDAKERAKAVKEAESELREALGLRGKKASSKNPELEAYVSTLSRLSTRLTREELDMARVIGSEESLGRLVEAFQSGIDNRDGLFKAFDDLYNSYVHLRKIAKVTAKEFDDLSNGERALFTRAGKFNRSAFEAEKRANIDNSELFAKINPTVLESGVMPLVGRGSTTFPSGMEGLWAPLGVRSMMERMFQSYTNPTKFQKWLADVVDPLLLTWKTGVTVGSGPRYFLLNATSNLYMNFIGGVSLKAHLEAAQILNSFWTKFRAIGRDVPDSVYFARVEKAIKELREEYAGKTVRGRNVVDLLQDFMDEGGFTSTQVFFTAERVLARGEQAAGRALSRGPALTPKYATEAAGKGQEAYRNTIEFLMTNRVQTFLNSMNQASETFARFANFLDGYKKYGNKVAATDRMYALQFDYQDLSFFEEYLRRFIPFYTWTRGNIPLQIRTAILQPGKIQRFIYANENAKDAFGIDENESWMDEFLPEYAQLGGGFLTDLSQGADPLFFSTRLPYSDADRLLEAGRSGMIPFIRSMELANMLGPAATVPYELATGVNPGTGQIREPGEVGRFVSELIPQYGVLSRAASGASYLPIPGVQQGLQAVLPTLSMQSNINQKAMQNLLNVTGVGAGLGGTFGTLTPSTLRREVARQAERQNRALQQFAEDNDIDLTWLRAQVREGASAEQIALMIRMGEGKPSVDPREISETMRERAERVAGR